VAVERGVGELGRWGGDGLGHGDGERERDAGRSEM
jgi:hypothetical protein